MRRELSQSTGVCGEQKTGEEGERRKRHWLGSRVWEAQENHTLHASTSAPRLMWALADHILHVNSVSQPNARHQDEWQTGDTVSTLTNLQFSRNTVVNQSNTTVINGIQKICTFNSLSLSTVLSPRVSGGIPWKQGWLVVCNCLIRAQTVNRRARFFPGILGLCAQHRGCVGAHSGYPALPELPRFRDNFSWTLIKRPSEEAQTGWSRGVFFGMRKNDGELETPSRQELSTQLPLLCKTLSSPWE